MTDESKIVSGWLFFSNSNRHCTFLPDDDQHIERLKDVNWKLLLNKDLRQQFVADFDAVRTDPDAMLEGYKFRAAESNVRNWLAKHSSQAQTS